MDYVVAVEIDEMDFAWLSDQIVIVQVLQLKVDGVSFRFIPESSQIKHALNVSYCIFNYRKCIS